MYIFELIYKLTHKKNDKKSNIVFDVDSSDSEDEYNEEKCEHIFLPIDSTKKILACTKCGFILKVDGKPKKKNFFMRDHDK